MPRTHRSIPPLTAKDIARFWSNVDKSPGQGPKGECWEWTGYFGVRYYAFFSLKHYNFRASRVSWFLEAEIDPGPLLACHSCDNPKCVRPSHIFCATQLENRQDAKRKGRVTRGANCHLSKMTETKVRDLRKLRNEGWSYGALVKHFGISKSSIASIVKMKTWSHV